MKFFAYLALTGFATASLKDNELTSMLDLKFNEASARRIERKGRALEEAFEEAEREDWRQKRAFLEEHGSDLEKMGRDIEKRYGAAWEGFAKSK